MTVKNISITEDAYELLVRNKLKEESFSVAIRRLLGRKKSILEFAGAWKDMDDKEEAELKKNISFIRKNFNDSLSRRSRK